MAELKRFEDGTVSDSRDQRTVSFRAAEFGNAWAVHRGKVFGDHDLSSFQEEWKAWLAARDAEILRSAAALLEAAAAQSSPAESQ